MRLASIVIFLSAILCTTSNAQEYIPPAFRVLDISVDVKWEGDTFEDAVEWMREKVGWNVSVRWREIEKLGVNKDTPISLNLKSVPVQVVMSELIGQLSLAYQLNKDLLIISSDEDFAEEMHVVVYNVTDILMSLEESNGRAPAVDLRDSTKRSFFGDATPGESDLCKFEENKGQLEGIVLMIKPHSWKVNGGKGTITWIDGFLVVRNSLKVHALIGKGN